MSNKTVIRQVAGPDGNTVHVRLLFGNQIIPQPGRAVNDLDKMIAQAARLTARHLAAGHPEIAAKHLAIGRALSELTEGGAHGTT